MKLKLKTAPAVECLSLSEVKAHLRLDSGSLVDNLESLQSIAPGSHTIHELLTLDVAPGGAWLAGDTLRGGTSTKTCVIVTVHTTKTYTVKSRSGAFELGEVITNGTFTADQGPAFPTFAYGYLLLGTSVEVLGYQAVVNLVSGTNGATGTVDCKIQESNDGTTWTDWTDGAFAQITEDGAGITEPDNATYEKAYTGDMRYIRTVAKVLLAACEFGTEVLRYAVTSTEDAQLTAWIKAARERVEAETWRALITQTWEGYLDAWPSEKFIMIPKPPLQSVAITYRNENDAGYTNSFTTFAPDIISEPGYVRLDDDENWPSDELYHVNGVKLTIICGYGATTVSVPFAIRAAMLLMISDMYENRGTVVIGAPVNYINQAIDNLLNLYRMNRF